MKTIEYNIYPMRATNRLVDHAAIKKRFVTTVKRHVSWLDPCIGLRTPTPALSIKTSLEPFKASIRMKREPNVNCVVSYTKMFYLS